MTMISCSENERPFVRGAPQRASSLMHHKPALATVEEPVEPESDFRSTNKKNPDAGAIAAANCVVSPQSSGRRIVPVRTRSAMGAMGLPPRSPSSRAGRRPFVPTPSMRAPALGVDDDDDDEEEEEETEHFDGDSDVEYSSSSEEEEEEEEDELSEMDKEMFLNSSPRRPGPIRSRSLMAPSSNRNLAHMMNGPPPLISTPEDDVCDYSDSSSEEEEKDQFGARPKNVNDDDADDGDFAKLPPRRVLAPPTRSRSLMLPQRTPSSLMGRRPSMAAKVPAPVVEEEEGQEEGDDDDDAEMFAPRAPGRSFSLMVPGQQPRTVLGVRGGHSRTNSGMANLANSGRSAPSRTHSGAGIAELANTMMDPPTRGICRAPSRTHSGAGMAELANTMMDPPTRGIRRAPSRAHSGAGMAELANSGIMEAPPPARGVRRLPSTRTPSGAGLAELANAVSSGGSEKEPSEPPVRGIRRAPSRSHSGAGMSELANSGVVRGVRRAPSRTPSGHGMAELANLRMSPGRTHSGAGMSELAMWQQQQQQQQEQTAR